MVKYRDRVRFRDFCIILFLIVFSIKSISTIVVNTPLRRKNEMCYVIKTTGENFKYVYMITDQLSSMGISKILIFHEQNHGFVAPPILVSKYTYLSSNGDLLSWVFDDTNNCDYAVILDDDILLGADVTEYFNWGKRLMDVDDTVHVIGAYYKNSERHMSLNPQVFIKSEQDVDVGWMTSKKIYRKYGIIKSTNVVVPHLPRIIKLIDKTHQLSMNNEYGKHYVPIEIFSEYDTAYVGWLKDNFYVVESNVGTVVRDIRTTQDGSIHLLYK